MYGDVDYNKNKTPKYVYQRYKITYHCEKSKLPNKNAKPLPGGKQTPIDAFAIYKTKVIWDKTANNWKNPETDGVDATYKKQLIADYIEDLVFIPIDEEGKIINPPPTPTNATKNKLYKIKTIDIALTVRSTKNFFRNIKARFQETLNDQTRKKVKTDRYLRESIVVTAHARNLGMQ